MSITSSREREENKKYAAPPTGRDYPPTATGSAWVDYSILCRIWQDTGADCHVAALLAMTGRGIDKDLKAGIIMGKRGRCSDWVSPSCGYEVTAGL